MRVFKTEGIIIKRRNAGEADRILTVFTKHYGKMQIKAKGVRKITSRRASHVELLNLSYVTLYKAHVYPILTEAQMIDSFLAIKSDLKKVGLAYHLCELINSLCPENQEQRRVFLLFEDILKQLSENSQVFSAIRAFEINLLNELGYISEKQITTLSKPSLFIENIIEKKLKTLQILPKLL